MMKRIYCISGLGADHRLFQRIAVDGYELVAVPWVPFNAADTVETYAVKMAAQIPEAEPVILGLSFGGMLAVEIARRQPVKKAILISSAKTAGELNIPGGKIARWVLDIGIIPRYFLGIPHPITLAYLGAKAKEDRTFLKDVIWDSDQRFTKWALKAIGRWKSASYPANIVHIHGTADKVIAAAKVKPDFWIEGGSHIMIYNRADEINKIISQSLL
jgi:pimeloyl-ACP methyl ester carboxylesterase